jgi:hypothetical protein
MDKTLARGFAREMFRGLTKLSNRDTNPATPVVTKLQQTFLVDGGVDETRLVALAAGLEKALVCRGNIIVESRRIKHPLKNKIIIETTCAASVKGEEQSWMIAAAETWVMQRNMLRIVETVHHIAVSEHAVFRLFERGDMNNGLTLLLLESATLWAPILLHALYGIGSKVSVGDGTEVAIPFAGGLLLGTICINRMEGPEQGPTISEIRHGGQKRRRLKAPFQLGEDSIPTIGINTYVSRQELFKNQQAILTLLEKFEEAHKIPMANMRRLCALGYPDGEVTKVLGPVQFNEVDAKMLIELAGQIRAFFATPEWVMHANSHRPRVRFLQ